MPAEQKPVIRKIDDVSKEIVKTTVDRTQEVAITSVDDNCVARTIKRMGIPTAKTLKFLSEQLLDVSEKLSKLSDKEESAEEKESYRLTLCPIAATAGCKKCPAYKVCVAKGILGDYKYERALD